MRPAGILVVDKPAGITSRAAAVRAGAVAGATRSGHAGTLDPLATGVLVVCLGRATLLSRFLAGGAKVYRAVALLGMETDTYDVDGEVVAAAGASGVTAAEVSSEVSRLTGELTQEPPPFSAVKHEGKALHRYARSGVEVPPKPRAVYVRSIEIEALEPAGELSRATLLVECGPGTYIRSLVSDLGRALGCGACVEALRRLRSGCFSIEDAVGLDALESGEASLGVSMLSMEEATAFMDTIEVGADAAEALGMGKPLTRPMAPNRDVLEGATRVLDASGKLLAVLGPPRPGDPGEVLGRAMRVIRPAAGNEDHETA